MPYLKNNAVLSIMSSSNISLLMWNKFLWTWLCFRKGYKILMLYFKPLLCLLSGSDNVHLKILVPSIAAGAIIGKGGETIAQVQKDAGARVKMSKANDFYPGKSNFTTDIFLEENIIAVYQHNMCVEVYCFQILLNIVFKL